MNDQAILSVLIEEADAVDEALAGVADLMSLLRSGELPDAPVASGPSPVAERRRKYADKQRRRQVWGIT